MKKHKLHWLLGLVILILGLSSVVVVMAKRGARISSASITITNNSSFEIKHVYFSHVGQDDWSADQLNDNSIGSGSSRTLAGVSWDQPNMRLIGEDQNGCFVYQTLASGQDSSWTIASDATADCGN